MNNLVTDQQILESVNLIAMKDLPTHIGQFKSLKSIGKRFIKAGMNCVLALWTDGDSATYGLCIFDKQLKRPRDERIIGLFRNLIQNNFVIDFIPEDLNETLH